MKDSRFFSRIFGAAARDADVKTLNYFFFSMVCLLAGHFTLLEHFDFLSVKTLLLMLNARKEFLMKGYLVKSSQRINI